MSSEKDKKASWAKQKLEVSMLFNISEMAQSVAYEINNPLMIINGYAKRIKKKSGDPDYHDLDKDLKAIQNSSERINLIIQNLLKYSKEALDLPLQQVSYGELIERSIELFRETSTDTKSIIEFNSNTEARINVNPTLCIQAIVNVFRHCVDHASQKEEARLELAFRKYKERIELVIKENGEKISEEVQSKMFYQTFSTSGEGEVIGMGMNSSFNIAKKFNGDLYFDNSYTENAFILSFPEV